MERESKTWNAARRLIVKHGREALALSTERTQRQLAAGEYASAANWAKVTEVVATLLDRPAATPPPKTTEPPLEDLMNDPVTETMLRGDEQRRQELTEVVEKAQRKLRRRNRK